MPQQDHPYFAQGADEDGVYDMHAAHIHKQEHEALELERQRNALAPEPGLIRTIVKLPKAKHPGGMTFWDNVPAHQASFAWTEANVTLGPTGSLQAVPGVPEKVWYNQYIYVPEERPMLERHYLERFAKGPNGEWIDTVKAQRMVSFIDDKLEEYRKEAQYGQDMQAGVGVEATKYVDAYSGQRLVSFAGQLHGEQDLMRQYKVSRSDWKEIVDTAQGGYSFDNLRVPWPFAPPERNKKITQQCYEWFDRRNPYISSDRRYEIMELQSAYLDKDQYDMWRAKGGSGPLDFMADLQDYYSSIDGHNRY